MRAVGGPGRWVWGLSGLATAAVLLVPAAVAFTGFLAITVIALTGLCLTEGAGSAFEQALGLSSNGLVAQHVHAAHILRLLFIAFTAVVLVTLLAHRRPTGIDELDGLLARDWVRTGLRIAVWALAIAAVKPADAMNMVMNRGNSMIDFPCCADEVQRFAR